MITIAKNVTSNDITLHDLSGIVISGNSELNLGDYFQQYDLAISDDLLVNIATGNITINNGEVDLIQGEAIRFISFYKHVNPISNDGKEMIRADSRPPNTETYFTCRGDSDTTIGAGKIISWDFSNDDDIITSTDEREGHHNNIPTGYKRKRVRFKFIDPIYLKDGTLYFSNAKKWSWVDMYIVVPPNNYYYNRDGSIAYATDYIPLVKYINHKIFVGTCLIGDEVHAEGCQANALPPGWEIWGDFTVPTSDVDSYGYSELQMYRVRSYLYPTEWPA